jgi:hypothetical protein
MIGLPNTGTKANWATHKIDLDAVLDVSPSEMVEVTKEGINIRK